MSGWFISDDRVPVEGLECHCLSGDGTPVHPEGDTIWLRAELDPAGALEAVGQFGMDDNGDVISRNLGLMYCIHGIVAWTFVDEQGKEVPCTRANIQRLKWETIYPVAEKASELYSEGLLRPLVARVSKSLRNGQTAASTSATTGSSSTRRKR